MEETGTIIGSLDLTTLLFSGFVLFFFGLVFYLQKESRREGFPMETDTDGHLEDSSGPSTPKPKAFHLQDGRTVYKPDGVRDPSVEGKLKRLAVWPGAPSDPVGDPMAAEMGPGGYTQREDIPDMTHEHLPKIVPMRMLEEFSVAKQDSDPRGFDVIGADDQSAGKISDIWVDRAEALVRYYEVELNAAEGEEARKVLLPFAFANVKGSQEKVLVPAILAEQFSGVPAHASDQQVTRLEEDRISAYYGGGLLYATPDRKEPWI
jgi:photosynthetic reaction center H subunit